MKLFYFQIIVLTLVLFYITWIFRIFPGSTIYYERKYNKALTGLSFTAKEVYVHNSERYFNGDGYSMTVFELDETIANKFTNPTSDFFTDYPIKDNDRKDWLAVQWKKSPINDNEKLFLDFAFGEFIPKDKIEAKQLQDQFDYIDKIMHSKECYYAYNYKMHGEEIVGDIDFFIIVPKDKKLIIINHNT
jgi:hypothetical protein